MAIGLSRIQTIFLEINAGNTCALTCDAVQALRA